MKKLHSLTGFLFLCTILARAQETVDTQMMQKIKDEEKNNSQIVMIAHNITDVIGPRLTNSPGYNRALDWVTEICKKWGLQNAGREPWGEFGKGWSNEQATLAMKMPYYENIIGYPVPWCKSTGKAVRSELFMLDAFDSATIDRAGDSIKGKIVMVKPGNLKIPDAFKAYATRLADTALNNLPDDYMITRKEMEGYLPLIKKRLLQPFIPGKKGRSRGSYLATAALLTVPYLLTVAPAMQKVLRQHYPK